MHTEFQSDKSVQEKWKTSDTDTGNIDANIGANASDVNVNEQLNTEYKVPDGGWIAWSQVLCAHLVVFNTWGSIQTFGTWQSYYNEHLGCSNSTISWIGSIQLFLLFILAPLAGRALDAGYFRPLIFTGLAIQLIGLFCTSAATQYWQIFIAQGIVQGIGSGLQFAPAMALLNGYFKKRRAFAMALVSSGSSTGGVVYPLVVRALISKAGFGWTMRTIAFITMAVGITAATFLRRNKNVAIRKTGPLIEIRAFKEPAYATFCAAVFFSMWGVWMPLYYLISYARDVAHFSSSSAILLLLVANVVGIASRTTTNWLADRVVGPTNMCIVSVAALGPVNFLWPALNRIDHPSTGMWVYGVVFGLVAAMLMGLFPPALSALTTDVDTQGARMGMGFAVAGLSGLTGPVIGGVLIQRADGSYLLAQMWAGSSVMVGLGLFVVSRWLRVGWRITARI